MKLPGTYIITFTCLGLAFAAPGKGKSAEGSNNSDSELGYYTAILLTNPAYSRYVFNTFFIFEAENSGAHLLFIRLKPI